MSTPPAVSKGSVGYTVGQLLAFAEVAYQEDDRPHLKAIKWTPDGMVACNGHRLAYHQLAHDRDRDFAVDATAVRRWLSGHRASDRFEIAVEVIGTGAKAGNAGAARRVGFRPLDKSGCGSERLLLPLLEDKYPPFMTLFPDSCLDGPPDRRRTVIPGPSKRLIVPHALAPRYLEGVGKLAAAFFADQNGMELVSAAETLAPVCYASQLPDGELWLLCMPMRPPWADISGQVREGSN